MIFHSWRGFACKNTILEGLSPLTTSASQCIGHSAKNGLVCMQTLHTPKGVIHG